MIFLGLVLVAGGLGGCAFFLKGIHEQQVRRNDLYEKVNIKSATAPSATPAQPSKSADEATA